MLVYEQPDATCQARHEKDFCSECKMYQALSGSKAHPCLTHFKKVVFQGGTW